MKPGKIVIGIDKKVYFEYYLLEKPKMGDFLILAYLGKRHELPETGRVLDTEKYNKAMKAYEASKRSVEVSNVYWNTEFFEWWYDPKTPDDKVEGTVINNQPCKAEVTDKAKIIELIK